MPSQLEYCPSAIEPADVPARREMMSMLLKEHSCLELRPETLFLCVNMLDRLATPWASLPVLTALFTAAKYEELDWQCCSWERIWCQHPARDIVREEKRLLESLQYRLAAPCPLFFLSLISKEDWNDELTQQISRYLLRATIIDPSMAFIKPSRRAAAALCLARRVLGKRWVSCYSCDQHDHAPDIRTSRRRGTLKVRLMIMRLSNL